MKKTDKEIPFCEFDGDPNEQSEIRLWYECPKCHKKIWTHLYNEHVHTCSRAKVLRDRLNKERQTKQPNQPVVKKRLVDLPTFRSTGSRHRRRPIKR